MTLEDQHTDRKSLRTVAGKTADWEALAKDCVCFANGAGELAGWLGRLQALALVQAAGRTQGTRYFVDPALLRGADLKLPTTLLRIEPHRLRALILEDLARYPGSSSTDVNRRIGGEISAKTVKRALDDLAEAGQVSHEGERRWRRYRPTG